MAFTVQSDTGDVENANAYIDVAYLLSYRLDRGSDLSDSDTEQLQAAIVKATDYLDTRFRFVGVPLTDEQTTAWPRADVYNYAGVLIEGLPLAIKQACAEYAAAALALGDITPTPSGQSPFNLASKTRTVGPITTVDTYVNGSGAGYVLPSIPSADLRLKATGFLVAGRESYR
jgi:hypothetical protein